MGLILCNSALHNSTLDDRFLNLEIPQKAEGVTLGVTGKSVTFFVRKLVQNRLPEPYSNRLVLNILIGAECFSGLGDSGRTPI